jgi:hypothetical protein
MDHAFQLVLEFEGKTLHDLDRISDFEDILKNALPADLVDGLNAGQGIVNIFIHTDRPEQCFEEAMHALDGAEPGPSAAGYRAKTEENYVRLWPKGDPTPFRLW